MRDTYHFQAKRLERTLVVLLGRLGFFKVARKILDWLSSKIG
ncbi:hypothetical protein [Bacillus sp. B-jedd]|nr:hypothetical protein [Bacillus sp. B-jedd]CEG28093.1 hypothetical protein BN1002_02972 [Bacillus sp. B-jedd]